MKSVQGESMFLFRDLGSVSLSHCCFVNSSHPPASSSSGSQLKTCSHTFVWMSEVSCVMDCCIFGRWWETSIGPVMLHHLMLRSNGPVFSVVDFLPSSVTPVRVSITHCSCSVPSCSSSLPPVLMGSGCCCLTSPDTPSDGKANLPGFQTLSTVLVSSLWQFQPCLWPAGGRKSSEPKAGRSCMSLKAGGVEFALLCHELAKLSAFGPWTWVYLVSARNVLQEWSTLVLKQFSLWELPVMSRDSLNSFLSRGQDCDWQSFRLWWNSGILELAEFPLSPCCCEVP